MSIGVRLDRRGSRRRRITMRFLMIYQDDPKTLTRAPDPAHYEKMRAYVEGELASGRLISTGGIQGGSAGIRVRNTGGGEFLVTDGPYAEAKELVGGYAICELPSREAAIAAAKEFLALMGSGVSEIHQLG
jgi:hypothetical protein